MITLLIKRANGKFEHNELEKLTRFRKGDRIWADVTTPTEEDMEKLILNFKLHPLAIEDSLSGSNNIKIDVYDDHLFLIFGVPIMKPSHKLKSRYLFIFLSDEFIITLHHKRIPYIEALVKKVIDDPSILAEGTDFMLHRLLDVAVDQYSMFINEFERRTEKLEDDVLIQARDPQLQQIFNIKKFLNKIRQNIQYEINIVDAIMKTKTGAHISDEAVLQFKDVRDHLVNAMDAIDRRRESFNTLLTVFLNSSQNRLAETMQILTLFTVLMMTPTFIVGYYGMNVPFPLADSLGRFALLVPLALMAIVTIIMILFFKRRKWFK